jgi:hypothetical protein
VGQFQQLAYAKKVVGVGSKAEGLDRGPRRRPLFATKPKSAMMNVWRNIKTEKIEKQDLY